VCPAPARRHPALVHGVVPAPHTKRLILTAFVGSDPRSLEVATKDQSFMARPSLDLAPASYLLCPHLAA
jgi:hypothetical protein